MTNLTRSSILGSLALLYCCLFIHSTSAQSLVCTDMVQVSVDGSLSTCSATLAANTLASGGLPPLTFHSIINGVALIPATAHASLPYVNSYGNTTVTINNTKSLLGKSLTFNLSDANGNKCWSKVIFEDKSAPTISCPSAPILMNCLQAIPATFPTATDNCGTPVIQLVQEIISIQPGVICEKDTTVITRTYVAVDDFGNRSNTCQTIIKIGRPNIQLIDDLDAINDTIKLADLLQDAIFQCSKIELDKHVSPEFTGKELLKYKSQLCGYQVNWSDNKLVNKAPCDYTYKIIRDWIAICWCNGAVLAHQQIIKVIDTSPPPVDKIPASIELSANIKGTHPSFCASTQKLPLFESIDTCSGPADIKISTPLGFLNNGDNLPLPGLTIGSHTISVILTDKCGNQSTKNVTVVVKDDVAPIAVCQEFTVASLTNEGKVTVFASSFDAGSYDNCCLDKILVKKMGQPDADFSNSVTYSCMDIPGPHKVILRAFDCNSPQLTNDCMVDLRLQDKMAPSITCPDLEISCDEYSLKLREQLAGKTGEVAANIILGVYPLLNPTVNDNCTPTRSFVNYIHEIDKCYAGTIKLRWIARDAALPSHNTSDTCTTTITSKYYRDILWHASNSKDSSDIVFPSNKTLECTPSSVNIEFGKVWINPARETCELIATSYCDVVYKVDSNACFKIVRTWKVVDWCTFDGAKNGVVVPIQQYGKIPTTGGMLGDSTYYGRVEVKNAAGAVTIPGPTTLESKWRILSESGNCHNNSDHLKWIQTIYVIDDVAPVFVSGCSIDSVGIVNDICTATVTLPSPALSDCSPNVSLTVSSPLGEGFGPFSNVKPGTYGVTYIAADKCNNFTTCKTSVKVYDKKPPVAYCLNSLIIVLNDQGKASVNARDFDFKSFDNCSSNLKFSFSSDTSFTTLQLECRHIGAINIEMWVTDEHGNQDYCQTLLFVQQHLASPCPRPRLAVAGKISNENDNTIDGVTIKLSGSNDMTMVTSNDGKFQFPEIEPGADYSITPGKYDYPLNGVTTFDMVLISRHILGVQLLDSPYKIIAADVNNSGSVTTLDLVELRKLILFVNSSFPGNSSWRFVDKKFVFPNPLNPFSTPFPELISYNNVESDLLDADFVGIKIGDVNSSTLSNNIDKTEQRNTVGEFAILIKDEMVHKGETIEVPFSTESNDFSGFQFALNFDDRSLEFVEALPALVSSENIGLSKLSKGVVLFSWHTNNSTVLDKTDLVILKFKVKTAGKLSDFFAINSEYLIPEAYSKEIEPLKATLKFTNSSAENRFELLQNTPNPFVANTTLGFYLPHKDFVKISVSDVAGKVVKVVEGNFEMGYNEIIIKRDELGPGGVYFYQLQSGLQNSMKKMIMID